MDRGRRVQTSDRNLNVNSRASADSLFAGQSFWSHVSGLLHGAATWSLIVKEILAVDGRGDLVAMYSGPPSL